MKILIVGAWYTDIYEEPYAVALESLKHTVVRFKWVSYFRYAHLPYYRTTRVNFASSVYYRFQNKYLIGPVVRRINRDLRNMVRFEKPDLVFLYRATHIRPATVKYIRSLARVVTYHNDDPLVESSRWQNRNYLSVLPLADINYVYRPSNLAPIAAYGPPSKLLMPCPNSQLVFPLPKVNRSVDVVFIGHYEDDGREAVIREFMSTPDVDFELYGTGWEKSTVYPEILQSLGPVAPIYGQAYNRKLNAARISLCFFSALNNDVYTRRSFEIPAAGSFLLSQYSEESARLFRPGKEADYFSSPAEAVEKARYYLTHPQEREQIAAAAHLRLQEQGHTCVGRVQRILDDLGESMPRVGDLSR